VSHLIQNLTARSQAALKQRPQLVDPLLALRARAEARAQLWAACEFDMPDAVDPPQADAIASGLVDQLGQDAMQQVLAAAFGDGP
jgi:hypothetical protein